MNEQAATSIPITQDVTGPRIVAAIIDIVLLGILFVIMSAVFGDSTSSSGDDGASFNLSLNGLPALIYFAVVLAYYFVLELKTGQTVGKMLLKLKVVTVSGAPLTPQSVGLRTVLRIIDSLPFLYLVGFIAVAVSKKKQRLGDMVAGTQVVKA